MTSDVSIDELRRHVEHLYNCRVYWRKAEMVQEKFKEKSVWNGIVQSLELEGPPSASFCHAWSSQVEGQRQATGSSRFFIIRRLRKPAMPFVRPSSLNT